MKHFSNRPETVDISEEQARIYWTRRLNVSEVSLKAAIRALRDVDPAKIEAYLRAVNGFAGTAAN
ncbi:DUF3606 domain-containing protein [Pedobacter yulinensis]|nr:DUF3606 domain-containing protein [Pedobacter yulinensis]